MVNEITNDANTVVETNPAVTTEEVPSEVKHVDVNEGKVSMEDDQCAITQSIKLVKIELGDSDNEKQAEVSKSTPPVVTDGPGETSASSQTSSSSSPETPTTEQKHGGTVPKSSENKVKGGRLRDRKQQGKKGAWTKLDVDISFNNKDKKAATTTTTTTTQQQQQPFPSGRRNRKSHQHDNNKKQSQLQGTANPNAAPSSPRNHQQHKSRHGKSHHGSGADTNPNWRKKTSKGHPVGSPPKGKWSRGAHVTPSAPFFPTATEEQVKESANNAVKQIEYFLSVDELVRNTYLRHHMDTEGFLPAAIIFNFPSVAQYGVPYNDLLHALTVSDKVEVDSVNETMRVKGDYKTWLFPNEEGGHGCPRWIKDPTANIKNKENEEEQIPLEAIQDQESEKDSKQQNTDDHTSSTSDTAHCTESETECLVGQ